MSTPQRITIVGMNNPLSMRPEHALWPDPPNCTGWRLWQITAARTGCTADQYARAFRRTNMLVARHWNLTQARRGWGAMRAQLEQESDIILLLGAATRVGAQRSDLPALGIRGQYATLPHPSGLNRWYNDRRCMAAAEILMEELYCRASGLY